MRKFHRVVEQAVKLHPYQNQKDKRYIYLLGELTRPAAGEKPAIDVVLQSMASEGAKLGTDSTPEERNDYRLYCANKMEIIRAINPLYHSTIIIQDE